VRLLLACVAVIAGAGAEASPALALSFGTAPAMPALPAVTLNGQAQTVHAQMGTFAVTTVLGDGAWNVTVNGDASAGHSAVFKVDCPGPSACGADPVGYVAGGPTLPANSLTLNSTGASWTAFLGASAPSFLCNTGCNVDTATPVKVATDANPGLTTWTTQNFSASSLALTVPTTTRTPTQPGEVYKVDLVWTLTAGP
jgi:hypothetical protein